MKNEQNKNNLTDEKSDVLCLWLKSKMMIMDENDKNLPIYLIGIGEDLDENVYRKDGFFHDQILLVESGSGILGYGNKKHIVKAKSAIFIPKGIPHSYTVHTSPFKVHWICFDGSHMPQLLSYFNLKDICCFETSNFNKLLATHSKLSQLTEYHYNAAIFSRYTYDLFIDFVRQKNAVSADIEKIAQVSTIKKYLDQHFNEDISLDFLADEFKLSKYKICRYFSETYGISLHEYFVKTRLQYAKFLLTSTNITITEIAAKCGFNDNVYFGKVFKKYETFTPQEYRKRFE